MSTEQVIGVTLTEHTVTKIYGMHIADRTDLDMLDEEVGPCLNNGSVGFVLAGAYNKHMTFLALSSERVEPGEYVFHSGIHAVAPKFERDRWNDDLHAVVDRLGLEVVEGPGWFTIPSES